MYMILIYRTVCFDMSVVAKYFNRSDTIKNYFYRIY